MVSECVKTISCTMYLLKILVPINLLYTGGQVTHKKFFLLTPTDTSSTEEFEKLLLQFLFFFFFSADVLLDGVTMFEKNLQTKHVEVSL